jgi:hydroxymethylpyrimidine/phosphomethylpyrimidine kinase
MKPHKPCVLTIAGSDSSGGAGIQADIKTICAIGCYAASVITALTAQNTLGVQAIAEVSADFVSQQLKAVFTDLNIRAVKIGMLFNQENISIVAEALLKFPIPFIILDPVMIAKNGCALIDKSTFVLMQEKLFPKVNLLTPNLIEAENILNIKITSSSQQYFAAIEIGKRFNTNVLVKGGHLLGNESNDVVYLHLANECIWFNGAKIQSKNTHGTGCTLSSAIASYLALGFELKDAIRNAKNYLTKAIIAGQVLRMGAGHGPVDHFFIL